MPNDSIDVRVTDFPGARVAVLEHHGDPASIRESIDTFIAWRQQAQLAPPASATFNIVYGAPDAAEPDAFRLDLCAATDRTVGENPFGIIEKTIPPGRCAVLRHVGSDVDIEQTVRFLAAQWLPQSGETRRDYPIFFQRLHFGPGVSAEACETDIFLPLK